MEKYQRDRHSPYQRAWGSPYERGCADAYYGRPFRPHLLPNAPSSAEAANLTEEEAKAYSAGYEEAIAGVKDWGDE